MINYKIRVYNTIKYAHKLPEMSSFPKNKIITELLTIKRKLNKNTKLQILTKSKN